MNPNFQFGRFDLALLITNTIIFGGCVMLLMLGKRSVTLILLSITTFGVLVGTVGRAYRPPPRKPGSRWETEEK